MQKQNRFITYLVLTLGSVVMAGGIYFFKFPNNFSTGGVSALSILLSPLLPGVSTAQIMMFFNVLLLVVGLIVFGRNFAFKTIYCSMALSIATQIFEVTIPMESTFTQNKMLELIFAIGLTAVGSAILFNEGASSGGTDVVAMILKKYTKLDIGKALLCSDAVLAMASFFIFDIETGMFSLLGLIMKAFIVDNVIDSINLNKCFVIVTAHDKEICEFIHTQLHRGATVSECSGTFTSDQKRMIITVLNRGQAAMLKQFIKQTDPKAFSIITNSSDILGKGFRTVM